MDRIAIYLRLSKEDDVNRDESNSISNQRELIRQYIRKDKKLKRLEITELVDDGYSGKNLNRPQMQKLLELIKARQVSCVIVKDMSRFSRDYLTLGKYLEQIFPFMGIRFIAINDHYDSDRCEGGVSEIDVAFKELLYDFYSVDLSQKVSAAIRVRQEKGYYMTGTAPYGYRKKTKHVLELEPVGAETVKRIFESYVSGKSIVEISRELNLAEIPCPVEYIRQRDDPKFRRSLDGRMMWTATSVGRLLANETYTGTYVYNKTHTPEVGGNSVVNPKKQWKRIYDHHPAIISRELFEQAQEIRKYAMSIEDKTPKDYILKGKVYCGFCGKAMAHAVGQGRPRFECRYRFYIRSEECVKSIRDEDLEAVLLLLIQEKIKNRIGLSEVMKEKESQKQKHILEAKGRLKEMEQTEKSMSDDLFSSYESYKDGIIEKETYLQQKSTYEEMIRKLGENIALQKEAIQNLEEDDGPPDGWEEYPEYLQISKPDRTLVELFIRKIIVYSDGRLDIIWNFKTE